MLTLPSHDEILHLYRAGRFLDAYELTRHAWSDRAGAAAQLDTAGLVLAGRLAERLGSSLLSRALFRAAHRRSPDDPAARHYHFEYVGCKNNLFHALKKFADRPELGSDDPGLEASWHASHAVCCARVRDFRRAEDLLRRADEQRDDSGWVDVCRSFVLFWEDRWSEALQSAERAWERSPGMPAAAAALSAALGALGQVERAADRLLAHHRGSEQSHEVLGLGLHDALAAIGRDPHGRLRARARELYGLALKLPDLAPLADRSTQTGVAILQTEYARAAGDMAAVGEHGARTGVPFFRIIAEHVRENPAGRRTLISHEPIRQSHNTCLPAAVAACLGALGSAVDHDDLGRRLTYGGTPVSRMCDWARKEGFLCRLFIGDAATARSLISAGIPFVFSFNSISNAHACAAVGLDEAARTLIFHDPSSPHLGELLIDRFDQQEAPVGPICLLVLPPDGEHARRVEAIQLPREEVAEALIGYYRALTTGGLAAAGAVVEGVQASEDPIVDYLRAELLLARGAPRAAINQLEPVFRRHPECIILQRTYLGLLQAAGDLTSFRETLRSIITRRPLPGIDGSRGWVYPESAIYSRYGDQVSHSATHHEEARAMLEEGLRRGPQEGEGYQYLGDLLWNQGQFDDALLAYRCAATLCGENEHHAACYAWSLKKRGRAEEGIEWLRHRAETNTSEAGGGAAWRSLVQELEQSGRPEAALEALEEGRRRRPEDGELAAFAAIHHARFGRWEDARLAVRAVRRHGTPAELHHASLELARHRGDQAGILEHARRWVDEAPRNLEARGLLAEATDAAEGPGATRELIEGWRRENPDSTGYEDLLLALLKMEDEGHERERLLRGRVERDPLDVWAWRELGWTVQERARMASEEHLPAVLEDLLQIVAACVKGDPDAPGTIGLQAELALMRGRPDEAIAYYSRALIMAHDYVYAVHRLFEITAVRGREERLAVVDLIDQAYAGAFRDLASAPEVAASIAVHLGLDTAIAAIERWTALSADDPRLVEAWADVNLNYGAGIPSVDPLVERLERTVERYPLDRGLRLSLAHCYTILGRRDDAVELLQAQLKIAPPDVDVRLQLAGTQEEQGDLDAAVELIRDGLGLAPRNGQLCSRLADLLVLGGRADEAIGELGRAVELFPANMRLWERRIELTLGCGRPGEAVETARTLTTRFPDAPYTQLVLARTLSHPTVAASRQEIEQAYQRAIAGNARMWDAVRDYASFLGAQLAFDRAREVLGAYIPLAEDDTPARGAMAEITRASGQRGEALEELAALLRSQPDYYYGWMLFIAWASEDDALDLARELLPLMSETVVDDVSLCCDRLELLARGGMERDELDRAWTTLTERCPGSMEAHLRRFDYLCRVQRMDDAAAALEAFAAGRPAHPQILARQIALHEALGEEEATRRYARDLWRFPGDEHHQAVIRAFAALRVGPYFRQAVADIRELIGDGERLSHATLYQLVSTMETDLLDEHGPTTARDFEALIDLLGGPEIAWDTGEYLAFAMVRYTYIGGVGFVRDWISRHEERCRGDLHLWQAAGFVHVRAAAHEEARRWLEPWRERRGVEQWAVASYATALMELGRYDETIEACEAALEVLEHDQSAPAHLELILLSALWQQRWDRYIELYRTHEPMLRALAPTAEGFEDFDLFLALLETSDASEMLRLYRQARPLRKAMNAWRKKLVKAVVLSRLSPGRRLLFRLGIR